MSNALKIKQLVIASNNRHKLSEIRAILQDTGLPVSGYLDVFDKEIEVIEDGLTFEDNARKKVQAFPEHPDYIYIGDDLGLEIEALNGAPGIYSARYAGENATYQELCKKVLTELTGVSDRRAQFRSVIAIRFPLSMKASDSTICFAEGIIKGTITHELQGSHGFGYDPIFIPEGFTRTFAEMDPEFKNKISHRYLALQSADTLIHHALSL